MNIVYSAADCEAAWREETSHLFARRSLQSNLVGAAVRSQSGQRPTEERESSRTVRAGEFRPVFGALCSHFSLLPEAVRGGCNCTPPSTTKQ